MVERGVRFVQIYSGGMENERSWDGHIDIARQPQPVSPARPISRSPALLTDLQARGLLDSTLVIWGGEFGRLPLAQKGAKPGRDHNPHAFTTWMAGGGVKGGTPHGADRRDRPQGGRRQSQRQRPARHDPAPAGHGPHAAHVPLQRPRFPPDRRGRRSGAGDCGVTLRALQLVSEYAITPRKTRQLLA